MPIKKIKLPDGEEAIHIQPCVSYENCGLTKEQYEIVNKAHAILGGISKMGYSQKFGRDLVTIKKVDGYLVIEIDDNANIVSD